MTQNEHVYAICCRQEVASDVVFGRNVKAIEGYAAYIFKWLSLVVSEIIQNKSFRDGGGHRR